MSDQQVFLGIVRAAETLTRHLTDVLEPFRLTLSQYSVLDSLRHADHTGLACGELADRMIARDPDITRLVDRLETRGLVTRHRGRPDRRVVRMQITAEGRLLLKQLDEPIGKLHARHLAPMGKRNLSTLSSLLAATEGSATASARRVRPLD